MMSKAQRWRRFLPSRWQLADAEQYMPPSQNWIHRGLPPYGVSGGTPVIVTKLLRQLALASGLIIDAKWTCPRGTAAAEEVMAHAWEGLLCRLPNNWEAQYRLELKDLLFLHGYRTNWTWIVLREPWSPVDLHLNNRYARAPEVVSATEEIADLLPSALPFDRIHQHLLTALTLTGRARIYTVDEKMMPGGLAAVLPR